MDSKIISRRDAAAITADAPWPAAAAGALVASATVAAIQFHSSAPALVLPFTCRGDTGAVAVHYGVTADPAGVGFDLLGLSFDEAGFRGYPVIRAEVSSSGEGYRAVFGWLQLIRTGPTADEAVA